jgi:hypothetical protein
LVIMALAVVGGCLDFNQALDVCEDGGRCSIATDAGNPDAASVDADAGPDAGARDAAAFDSGVPMDASVPDAGSPDSGMPPGPDAGVDAGRMDAGTAPCGPIVAVQAVPGDTGPCGKVIQNQSSLSFGINETAGDLLVAVAYGGQNPGKTTPPTTAPNMTFSVSDTLHNTYYAGPMFENSNSNQAAVQIFYAPNIAGGPNTVTVASSSSPSLNLWTGLFLQEYSGIATSDVVDVSSGQMAPAASEVVYPGDMVTSAACDLVVGAFTDGHVDQQALTPGAGWVFRSTDDWDPGAAVDNSPLWSALGSHVDAVMNLTGGTDDGWVATQVAFRASNTTPLPQPNAMKLTAALTVAAGACSPPATVQVLNGSQPANTATGMTVTLSGSTLTFYVDSSCAFPVTPGSSMGALFIGAGTNSRDFYFKASASGSPTLTATWGTVVVNQVETIN